MSSSKIGNMNVVNDAITVKVSSEIFTINHIQKVSSEFLEKAYVICDKNQDNFIVTLRPKQPESLEELGRSFNNTLIIFAATALQKEKNKEMQNAIIEQAALVQSIKETGFQDDSFETIEEGLKDLEKDSLEDPLGIMDPWTEESSKETPKDADDQIISLDEIKVKK